MPTTITGTDGVSQVQAGAVESGDLASGAIGSGDLPAGSVIQVVSDTFEDYIVSTNHGEPNDITAGAELANISFTPVSSSSLILVQTNSVVIAEQGTNAGNVVWLSLYDDGNHIASNSGTANFNIFNSAYNNANHSINYSYPAGTSNTRFITVRAGLRAGSTDTRADINGQSTENYTGSQRRIQTTVFEIAG